MANMIQEITSMLKNGHVENSDDKPDVEMSTKEKVETINLSNEIPIHDKCENRSSSSKHLLYCEYINKNALQSMLNLRKISSAEEKKTITFARSSVLAKVKECVVAMEKAQKELESKHPDEYNIENIENDKPVIEMNIGLYEENSSSASDDEEEEEESDIDLENEHLCKTNTFTFDELWSMHCSTESIDKVDANTDKSNTNVNLNKRNIDADINETNVDSDYDDCSDSD